MDRLPKSGIGFSKMLSSIKNVNQLEGMQGFTDSPDDMP